MWDGLIKILWHVGCLDGGQPRKERVIMAVLLTNGTYYIAHSSTGAVVKVSDIKEAQDFRTAERAGRQKRKTPVKCAGFYWMDTDMDIEEMDPDAQKGATPRRKKFSAKDRLAVYRKTEGHCYLCGEFVGFDSFEVEHHMPISKGGTNGLDNLYCSCTTCNAIKRDIYPKEFMEKISQIFLYQMQKGYGDSLDWKVAHRLLVAMLDRKREE